MVHPDSISQLVQGKPFNRTMNFYRRDRTMNEKYIKIWDQSMNKKYIKIED
jgi:hypothetical protein